MLAVFKRDVLSLNVFEFLDKFYLYDFLTETRLMPIANAAMRNIKTCLHSAIKANADEIMSIRNCGADMGLRIMNAIIALPTNSPKQNTMARFNLFCFWIASLIFFTSAILSILADRPARYVVSSDYEGR